MPAISTSAPGKIILFGEHAVVYGRPAIAVPVKQVQAKAIVMATPRARPGRVHIQAEAIGLEADLDELAEDHPLAVAVRGVMQALKIQRLPACTLRITSTIPVAAGLGSGAAVSVAVIRALSAFVGQPLADDMVSELAFQVEKIYHGTPSGIDNTVITYSKPVYYVSGQALQRFTVARPFNIVIGDTGIASPTASTVSEVRRMWQSDPERYEEIFDAIARIVQAARSALESGDVEKLGQLMNLNHAQLQELRVSSTELERLVEAAREAGASGAKLSGGGRGGNMIAVSRAEDSERIAKALMAAGATRTIITEIR